MVTLLHWSSDHQPQLSRDLPPSIQGECSAPGYLNFSVTELYSEWRTWNKPNTPPQKSAKLLPPPHLVSAPLQRRWPPQSFVPCYPRICFSPSSSFCAANSQHSVRLWKITVSVFWLYLGIELRVRAFMEKQVGLLAHEEEVWMRNTKAERSLLLPGVG